MSRFQYEFIQLRKCNTGRSVREWSGICIIIIYVVVPVSAWDIRQKKEKEQGKIKRVMAKIEKEESRTQFKRLLSTLGLIALSQELVNPLDTFICRVTLGLTRAGDFREERLISKLTDVNTRVAFGGRFPGIGTK